MCRALHKGRNADVSTLSKIQPDLPEQNAALPFDAGIDFLGKEAKNFQLTGPSEIVKGTVAYFQANY